MTPDHNDQGFSSDEEEEFQTSAVADVSAELKDVVLNSKLTGEPTLPHPIVISVFRQTYSTYFSMTQAAESSKIIAEGEMECTSSE